MRSGALPRTPAPAWGFFLCACGGLIYSGVGGIEEEENKILDSGGGGIEEEENKILDSGGGGGSRRRKTRYLIGGIEEEENKILDRGGGDTRYLIAEAGLDPATSGL